MYRYVFDMYGYIDVDTEKERYGSKSFRCIIVYESCIMLDLWCQIHTCLDLAIWKPTKLDVWVILEYAAAMTAGDDILQLPSCPNERSHSAKWPHARKHGNVTKSDCASHVKERRRKETHQNNAVHQNYMRCVCVKIGHPRSICYDLVGKSTISCQTHIIHGSFPNPYVSKLNPHRMCLYMCIHIDR